ncbi:MAG TPA: amino acid permease, partial [Planctomycetota bacterium]|nr:amino acid permease [Planctomycetota bacterium]
MAQATAARAGGTLDTFGGVFTPSILTILGVIFFLRLGSVVGEAGLGQALAILAVASGVCVLTGLSLAAVATNLRVKGGGDYYIISRTLGPEFGGAIGLVIFAAQALSIAFYCIGFGEAAAPAFAGSALGEPRLLAAAALALLAVFAWLGSDWATRLQYAIMAVLGASLASFFAGGLARLDGALLARAWAPAAGAPGFWTLFALFFPAVTGFTQGA